MSRHRSLLAPLVFTVLAAAPARATDYIVDRSHGPGTDFVSIQGAIFAAEHGDRIFVRTGTYSPFVVRKGLQIQAIGDVSVSGTVQVLAVPPTFGVVLAGVDTGDHRIHTPSSVAVLDCEVHTARWRSPAASTYACIASRRTARTFRRVRPRRDSNSSTA